MSKPRKSKPKPTFRLESADPTNPQANAIRDYCAAVLEQLDTEMPGWADGPNLADAIVRAAELAVLGKRDPTEEEAP